MAKNFSEDASDFSKSAKARLKVAKDAIVDLSKTLSGHKAIERIDQYAEQTSKILFSHEERIVLLQEQIDRLSSVKDRAPVKVQPPASPSGLVIVCLILSSLSVVLSTLALLRVLAR